VLADFVAGTGFVRGIDGAPTAALAPALAIDVALVAAFGISHSVLARARVKQALARVVPPVAERSTYVFVASAMLALTVWQWRALPSAVWTVHAPAARDAVWAVHLAGAALVVYSTFLTDHFDLFGVRQAYLYARGQPYTPVPFVERSLYRYVRHPMMVAIIVWLWAAPTMSLGRLVFAAAMTAYIAIGVAFEERALARSLGAPYEDYRARVRAFVPLRR
jgi:protein-S-isoprenylcysteine O-methyltransferase Ste14